MLNYRIIFSIILILKVLSFNSQNIQDSRFTNNDCIYATIAGLKSNKPISNVKIGVKTVGENFLIVDRFDNSENGKRFKNIFDIWGIKYKGDIYYHLSNARGINGVKSFVKIKRADLEKNYFCFSITGEIPVDKPISDLESGLVIGSIILSSVLTSELVLLIPRDIKSNKYWINKDGDKVFIYCVDTRKTLAPLAINLSKRRFKKLFPKNKELQKKIENNEVSYEEAINLINSL